MGSGVIQQKSLDGDDIPGFHSLCSYFFFLCAGGGVFVFLKGNYV
jgi:hypothetical protein